MTVVTLNEGIEMKHPTASIILQAWYCVMLQVLSCDVISAIYNVHVRLAHP